MAVGPGGVPAGIDPSLLTSAAFELVQVGFEIFELQCSLQCNDKYKDKDNYEDKYKDNYEDKYKDKYKDKDKDRATC